jgi:hypothetical protein
LIARSVFLYLLLLGGCASGAGLYRAGQQAQAQGHLEEARVAYEDAVRAEPNNAQYRAALEQLSREMASTLEAQANTAEQAKDWVTASRTWAKAAELAPSNEEYAVRRDLTLLKSQNLDPDGWYRGVAEVAKRHPTHEIVQRTLEKATKQAYLFRVGLAKRELGLRHYQQAIEQLDEALKIDPSHPGLTQADLNRARALAVVDEGDSLLAKDNPVGAAEKYQAAYELMPSPSIKRKLDKTRARTKELLTTLDNARKAAAKGETAKAIKLYALVVKMQGAPPEAAKELAELEGRAANEIINDAKSAILKNDLRAAHQLLARGVEQAKAEKEARDAAKAGLDRIERGEPASGLEAVEKAKLSAENEALLSTIKMYAIAIARRRVGELETLAKKDPAAAQRLLEELDPFKTSVPEIDKFGRSLTAGSFTAEIDRATEAAKKGDDRSAAENLMKALAISQAPKDIQNPIKEACEHLAKQRYIESERTFAQVVEKAPRSRLANAGVTIARMRRESVEQRALESLMKGDGQETRAVSVLEGSVGLTPESPYLKQGRETLLSRLTPSVTDKRAAELIELAGRLSAIGAAAKAALAEGAKQLGASEYQGSERAFTAALERAPEAKVATAGLEFIESRRNAETAKRESAQRAAGEAFQKRIADADAKAAKKDWAGALAIYNEVGKSPGAPAMDAKIAAAEAGLITGILERADAATAKSQREPARKELGAALDRIGGAESAKAKVKAGLERIAGGNPGEGLEIVKGAGLTSEPLLASVERYADMVAAQQLEEAKKAADKDPNRATEILRDLAPFEAKLTGIAELRKKIKVDAFTGKLQRAVLAAQADNKSEAVRVLREVLKETKAPDSVKQGVTAGCAALEKDRWIEAEKSFAAAKESSPESRIADYGIDVARTFRKRGETRALDTIRRDKDGVDDAIAVLAASRGTDSPARAEAEKLLYAKLKRAKRPSNKEVAESIVRIARLTGAEEAQQGGAALAAGDLAKATASFSAALAKDPKSEIAKLGLERSQSSMTQGVASGDVPIDSEATAMIFRGLLEKKPQDEALLATLEKLVDRIKKAPDREGTARLVALGAIASNMKGPLRESVDAGAKAFAKGDLDEAAKSLSKAVDIDPSNEIARTAFDKVKAEKKSEVVRRVVAESESGHDDRVKVALQKKLDEGGTVLEVMLAEATRLASLGREADAAKILDAANASSEGAAKAAVKRANSLLAAGRHQEAEKAYAEHKEASEVAEAGEKIAFTRHIQKLLEGVRALGRLEDLENSAKAAAEIFAIDPRDSDVKKALAKVYERAEQAAAAKNTAEMTKILAVAARVIGRTEELGAALRAMRGNRTSEANEMLRKIGAEFEQESEDEEVSEREPVVEYAKRARAALGKL